MLLSKETPTTSTTVVEFRLEERILTPTNGVFTPRRRVHPKLVLLPRLRLLRRIKESEVDDQRGRRRRSGPDCSTCATRWTAKINEHRRVVVRKDLVKAVINAIVPSYVHLYLLGQYAAFRRRSHHRRRHRYRPADPR